MASGDVGIEPLKAQSLMAALKEAQDTVRSYDTKAQILGVGYIFAIDIIQSIFRAASTGPTALSGGPFRFLAVWLLVFVPILMFARVLYPSRATISTRAKHTLYVPDADKKAVDSYKEEIAECDWLEEIATEIVKVSRLRDLKRRNFIQALWAAAASFFLMFVNIAARGIASSLG